tara:strand:- start:3422 stop:5833 length:2412 start_codon:yes stop_codon:yes gene_type:complete
MANKKFSEFELKTTTSNVSHIVGYNGAENVRITPANFLDTTGGPYLPLAGGIMVGNTTHNDNVKSIYGTANDGLEIFHDGSNSIIADNGTGNLILRAATSFVAQGINQSNLIIANQGGGVNLYYNNVNKFDTTNTGINVTGGGTFTDDVSVAGSGAKIISASSSNDNATFFLSGSGSGKDTRIVFGNNRNFLFETSSSSTPTSTGTPVLTLDTSLNATFAGNVDLGSFSTATVKTFSLKTSNSIFNISTDGTSGALGTTIGYSWANGGQGPLKFNNASGEVMRLDASGKLGIGTSSPSRDGINVFHTATPYVHLTNTTTGDTSSDGGYLALAGTELRLGNQEASGDLNMFVDNDSTVGMIIKSGGNVGIGNNPNSKLTVFNAEADTSINVNTGTTGSYPKKTGISFGATSTSYGGAAFTGGAGIQAINTAASGNPTDLTFWTNSNGSPTERMRIDSAGNVGMGQTTMLNTAAGRVSLTLGGSISGILSFGNAGTQWGGLYASADEVSLFGNNYVKFSSGASNSERMRITSAGNVGIKNTSPGASLEVNSEGGGVGGYTGFKLKYGTASVLSYYVGQVTAGNGVFTGTGQYRNSGQWQTEGTAASTITYNAGGEITFFTNAGLTANTDYNQTERMRLSSTGNVLVGKTVEGQVTTKGVELREEGGVFACTDVANNSSYFANAATSGTRQLIRFYAATSQVGSISSDGSTTAYNTTSDYRLKEDLQDFKGLDLVSKISVYDYKWKSSNDRSYGVMAHQLQEVLPQAVTGDKDAEEMQSVDYSKIVPLLVKSIQELKAEIELLKNK